MMIELKVRKNTVEMQMRTLENESKKEIESLCSTVESGYFKRQPNGSTLASEMEIDMMPTKRKENMTVFEQTVLVYKKKRYTNLKKRERIEFLKRNLMVKKEKIKKIKDVNGNCVWNGDSVSLRDFGDGEFFFDSNMNGN